jgi:replicative DNA helicase
MSDEAWIQKRLECEEGLAMASCSLPNDLVELSTVVTEKDFRNPFLGKLFGLAVLLNEAQKHSVDVLRGELENFGYLTDVSQLSDWIRLSNSYTTSGASLYFAHELRRLNQLEDLRRALNMLTDETESISADPLSTIEIARVKLETIYQRSNTRLWQTAEEVSRDVIQAHEVSIHDRNRIGMATGFYDLDEITGGFFPGQLWQIAGRSYMGKSTVALAFTQRQLDRGNGVYFASYEMTNAELMERILSDRASVDLASFTKGRLTQQELDRAIAEVEMFRNSNLFMDDMPPDTVQGIKARVKLASNQKPIRLLVIDHLLLFPHKDKRIPRHQQLVDVTRELKQLAKELELTILLLNQLNADADGTEPTDKHYSESKAILQNLDVSILIHRETKSSEDMLFKVTKNRKGAAGEVWMKFYGETQRVESVERVSQWTG